MPWPSYFKENVNSKTFFSHRRVFLVFFDLQLCFISQGSCSTNLTRLDSTRVENRRRLGRASLWGWTWGWQIYYMNNSPPPWCKKKLALDLRTDSFFSLRFNWGVPLFSQYPCDSVEYCKWQWQLRPCLCSPCHWFPGLSIKVVDISSSK